MRTQERINERGLYSGATSNSELENEDLAAADEAKLFKDIVIEDDIPIE